MANPFPRYKLQILAHSALSTGVEDDVIEEDDTTGVKFANLRTFSFVNMAKICHSNNAI